MGWQQRDGARPERWRWRDFERERESGWGREACTALSQETVLYLVSAAVAMTTTMAAAVTALSPRSPLRPLPSLVPSLFPPPPSPSLRLVFLSPLSPLASFTSHPGLLSLLLLPFKHSEWGKKHPDEKMAVVFHLYSRCV